MERTTTAAAGSAHARTDRAAATRERILDAAERLFAESGVHAVSHRAIADAAGQGNTAVVGYHFGTKVDLVRALVRRRAAPVDRIRRRMVDALSPEPELRGWVDCLVQPVAEHLDALGPPTWFARLSAQLMTDPELRVLIVAESQTPELAAILDGLGACLPDLPAPVRAERGDICRLLILHHFAERERALAEGAPTPRPTWREAAAGLADAIVGIWTSPATPLPLS